MLKIWANSLKVTTRRCCRAASVISLTFLVSYLLLDISNQSASAKPTRISGKVERLDKLDRADDFARNRSNVFAKNQSIESIEIWSIQIENNLDSVAERVRQDARTAAVNRGACPDENIFANDGECLPAMAGEDRLQVAQTTAEVLQLFRNIDLSIFGISPNDLLPPAFVPSNPPVAPTPNNITPFVGPNVPELGKPQVPDTKNPIATPNSPAKPQAKTDPNYFIPPRPVKLGGLNLAFTQIGVNDIVTSHRTDYEFTGGLDTGNNQTTNPNINATAAFSPYVEESVSKRRIYRLDYTNTYSQIRTIRQQRDISTFTSTPETVFGQRQQLSFIGDCIAGPNAGATTANGDRAICSFLPGLKTDERAIDDRLIPTKIDTTGQFGEIVTPASQAAQRQPGFSSGADGQEVGIDLYFPKIGTEPSKTRGNTTTIERFESTNTVPMVSAGRVRQIVLANGRETAIARTVRGFNIISGEKFTGLMAGLQAATELLPDTEPRLPDGKQGGSTSIDATLLLAANNNRVPENSLTAYSTGLGRGLTPAAKGISTASYQGIWFGFSPTVERRITIKDTFFRTVSPERVTISAGGEGGVDSDVTISTLLSQNGTTSGADPSTITNAYLQAYLTKYEREVDTRSGNILTERTNYYPHLSAAGNITTADSVLRYFGGVIFNPNNTPNTTNTSKTYIGVDFTKAEPQRGVSYSLSAIGYLNPDPEYFTKLAGSMTKFVRLGRNPLYNLNLTAGFNYAVDGTKIFDAVSFRSANSYLNFGATANLDRVALGTTLFLPTGLSNSIGTLISTSATWRIADGIAVSGFYTPTNSNSFRSPFGANAAIRLGAAPTSPTLSLGWNRNEIDLGTFGNTRAGSNDNVFSFLFRFDGFK